MSTKGTNFKTKQLSPPQQVLHVYTIYMYRTLGQNNSKEKDLSPPQEVQNYYISPLTNIAIAPHTLNLISYSNLLSAFSNKYGNVENKASNGEARPFLCVL